MESQRIDKILTVKGQDFSAVALDIFRFQYRENRLYHDFVNALQIEPSSVNSIYEIPFLPIQFFKSHVVKTTAFEPEAVFESSGTTQTINSRHHIKDISVYKESFLKAFNLFYGDPKDWCIIGLLPSYLERNNSSLVVMVDELVKRSMHVSGGFYLYEFEKLRDLLRQLESAGQKVLLIGVTFALLDFAESFPMQLTNTVVMETGGMKGRKQEMTRQEVHAFLRTQLGVDVVHSEYGMTELLSQAYSKGNGIFNCPPWMKVLVRDEEDPFDIKRQTPGRSYSNGVINVIDLANIYSCSFIATDDIGRLFADGSFEVMGRMDNSDVRGCSLMAL